MGTQSSYPVTLLEVNEKEEGVVALHLPIGPLKTRSGLEPVPRYEPSTYQPISHRGRYDYLAIRRDGSSDRSFMVDPLR